MGGEEDGGVCPARKRAAKHAAIVMLPKNVECRSFVKRANGPPMLKGWAPLVRHPSPPEVCCPKPFLTAAVLPRGGLLVTCGGGLFTGGFTGG